MKWCVVSCSWCWFRCCPRKANVRSMRRCGPCPIRRIVSASVSSRKPLTFKTALRPVRMSAAESISVPSRSNTMARGQRGPPLGCITGGKIGRLSCCSSLGRLADGGDEGLASEAWVHCHQQDEVEPVENVFDDRLRRGWIERDARLPAHCSDRLQRAVEVRTGLRMHRDDVGTGIGEGLEIRIRGRDHQVTIEYLLRGAADRLH